MVIPTHPPALYAGEAPDEKLKINKLGPYSPNDSTLKYGYISALQLIFEIISTFVAFNNYILQRVTTIIGRLLCDW